MIDNKKVMNLKFFGDFGKDFFTNAFNEAYNITEGDSDDVEVPSDVLGGAESVSNEIVDEIPVEKDEPIQEPSKPSKEEVERMYKEYFGEPQQPKQEEVKPELDEETKSAIELYKYLEGNPHLIQAMRDVDVQGYKELNTYVPDELTRRVQEMEEFIQERQFRDYVDELKSQYPDFDEEKVCEFAEEKEIYDLEVAYKALKADSVKEPNIEELRAQIKQEILNELKQNSLNTQTIIGSANTKPLNQTEVSLSSRESRIARAMGMTNEEYAKWR